MGHMPDSKESAPRTARELAQVEMQRRILQAAREQLTTVGPAQLSLRAIARELGMVSSAIYRYVASRDELITRLILESFHNLGDAVAAACQYAEKDPRSQLQTWAHTLRDWALEHPYDWALIYGVPIPGYAAPSDTLEPARRVNEPVLALYPDFQPDLESGQLLEASEAALAPLRSMLDAEGKFEKAGQGTATAMMLAWSSIHGFISLELGGHFDGTADDTNAVFAAIVGQLTSHLIAD